MPFRDFAPSQREAAIRTLLRGRRLAFEIGLDEDWFESAALTFKNAQGHWHYWDGRLRNYPATLVVLLAAAGSLYYRKVPSLWAKVGVTGNETALVGQALLEALKKLGLETFENLVEAEGALTYLTPILAHGGVPAYCLVDFFRLVDKSVAASTEAAELIQLWKARPSLTGGFDRPVARFFTYGGVPARDFLQRMIDFHLEADATLRSPSAEEAGLPASLVDAYWIWLDDPGTRTTGKGPRLPRPVVTLDPWDALGPTVELPPIEDRATWKIRDQRSISIYEGSRTFGHTVRLHPAPRWEVDVTRGSQEPRTIVFDGLERHGALFFEPPTSKLWRDMDQLRLDSAWLLHDKDLEAFVIDHAGTERHPTIVEDLPQPTGSWSSCTLAHVDLRNVRALLLKQYGTVKSQVRVVPQTSRPSLVGAALANVTTVAAATVFSAAPSIALPVLADVDAKRWQVTARCGNEARHEQAATLPICADGTLGLETLLHGWECRDVELAVRGPLGADLRTSVSVVPGLTLEAPGRVLGPSEAGTFRLKAADFVGLGRQAIGAENVIQARESATTLDVPVRCGVNENMLRIAVARIRWSLASGGHAEVTTDVRPLDVHASELTDDGRVAVLLVETGIADVGLRLRLVSGPDTLQQSEWARTSRFGRYAFPLAAYAGTIQQAGRSAFQFIVDVQALNVPVIRLRSELAASDVMATLRTEVGGRVVSCAFHDDGPERPREIRFWSIDRPWDQPAMLAVPDGQHGAIAFDAPLSIPPGRYLMEVGLPDPWNPPVRPAQKDANTAAVVLGTPEELDAHRRGLDAATPLALLELATAAGRVLPSLSWEDARTIATKALRSILVQLATHGHRGIQSPPFMSLVACVAATPARLAWAAAALLEEDPSTQSSLLRASIAILAARDGHQLDERVDDPSVTDAMVRDVWNACPPLAAMYDVWRARNGYDDSKERCLDFLGVAPPAAPVVGSPVGQEWQLPAKQLSAIQPLMELRAGKLLDLDASIDAAFEWLIAHRERHINSAQWSQQYALSNEGLHMCEFCGDSVLAQLRSRKPFPATDQGQKLPHRVLRCALHLTNGTEGAGHAVEGLFDICGVLPKQVTRDLTTAIYLTSCPGRQRRPTVTETDAEPT